MTFTFFGQAVIDEPTAHRLNVICESIEKFERDLDLLFSAQGQTLAGYSDPQIPAKAMSLCANIIDHCEELLSYKIPNNTRSDITTSKHIAEESRQLIIYQQMQQRIERALGVKGHQDLHKFNAYVASLNDMLKADLPKHDPDQIPPHCKRAKAFLHQLRSLAQSTLPNTSMSLLASSTVRPSPAQEGNTTHSASDTESSVDSDTSSRSSLELDSIKKDSHYSLDSDTGKARSHDSFGSDPNTSEHSYTSFNELRRQKRSLQPYTEISFTASEFHHLTNIWKGDISKTRAAIPTHQRRSSV